MMNYMFSAFADESSNSFSGQMDALKRNDFSFLEIRNLEGRNITEFSVVEARELSHIMDDNGLKVWSVGSPIGKIQIEDDFKAHLDLYRHTLDIVRELGAQNVRLFSFFMPKNTAPEKFRNLVLERMAIFADIANEYGVVPCHENEKGIYGDVASRCLEIHQLVPGMKAVFDPANFVQCDQDTLEAWEMLRSYVHYMHIKDALPNGCIVAPGMGHGNLSTLIVKYLAQGGKVLSLEPHLFEFVGLKDLEQEGDESIVGTMSFASAEAAFDYAADTLKKLLEGLA